MSARSAIDRPVKVKAKIKVTEVRCKGRIKAEGKKAPFPFCYRPSVLKEDAWGKKTSIELHSRVSGKLIGYLGPQNIFVTDPDHALTLDKLNAFQVPMIMRHFMFDAQSKSTNKYLSRNYRDAKKQLKAIVKAAKK